MIEIHLSKPFDSQVLQSTLQKILGPLIAVETTTRPGEFPFTITLPNEYLFQEECKIAIHLSKSLNVMCLISDEESNPYRWLLVNGTSVTPVFVDAEFLDTYDGFKLAQLKGPA